MIKTLLSALGAVVLFGGFIFLFALMAYRYECRMVRKQEKRDDE